MRRYGIWNNKNSMNMGYVTIKMSDFKINQKSEIIQIIDMWNDLEYKELKVREVNGKIVIDENCSVYQYSIYLKNEAKRLCSNGNSDIIGIKIKSYNLIGYLF